MPAVRLDSHFRALGAEMRLAAIQTVLSVAFLPDQAWRMGDAILRTLVRRYVTHRHLLQWTTAAQSAGGRRLDIRGFYQQMAGGTGLGLGSRPRRRAVRAGLFPARHGAFALLWGCAPAIALWVSRAPIQAAPAPRSHRTTRRSCA